LDVVFENSLNPTEVMATLRRERSRCWSQSAMIESLKQRPSATFMTAPARKIFPTLRGAPASIFCGVVDIPRLSPPVRMEFWAMISGGAALDRETEEFWHRLGYASFRIWADGNDVTDKSNHPFAPAAARLARSCWREVKLAEDGESWCVRRSASGYWSGEPSPVPGRRLVPTGLGAPTRKAIFFQGRKKEVIVTPAAECVSGPGAALRRRVKSVSVRWLAWKRGNAEPCAV